LKLQCISVCDCHVYGRKYDVKFAVYDLWWGLSPFCSSFYQVFGHVYHSICWQFNETICYRIAWAYVWSFNSIFDL